MESVKVILNFCNTAIYYDYKNVGIIEEINRVRKSIINTFYKTIPYNRILVSLSIIDDINFKTNNNDIENIIEKLHDIRENILYMLTFGKLVKDEQQTVKTEFGENNS